MDALSLRQDAAAPDSDQGPHSPPPAPATTLDPATADIKPARIAWLDIARGASILLVVLFHSSIVLEHYHLLHPVYWKINDLVGPIRMPVFFCISGLLAARVLQREWSTLLRKRVLLLWYLYALWATVQTLIGVVGGRTIEGIDLVEPIWWPNPVLWFIWALGFYLIIARLCRGRWQQPVFAAAILVSFLVEGGVIALPLAAYQKTLAYLPFFLAGAWYAPVLLLAARRPWRVLIPSAAMFMLLYALLRHHEIWSGLRTLLSVAGLLTGFSAAILATKVAAVSAAAAYFGRNTLPVYVAHTIILWPFGAAMAGLGATALPGVQLWAGLLLGALSVVVSLMLRTVVERLGGYWFYALPRRLQLSRATR